MNYFQSTFFLGLVLCSVVVIGIQAEDSKNDFQIPQGLLKLGSAFTARAVSWLVIHRLKTGNFRVEDMRSGQETRITLPIDLPPFPAEISLPSLEIPLNLPPAPAQNVTGLLAMCSPRIVGLDQMEDDLVIGYYLNKTATVSLSMDLPRLAADSDYMVDLHISYVEGIEIKELVISGAGLSSLGFSDFYISLLAKGQLPISNGEYMSLDYLDFDFGFEEAFLTAENLELNGEPIDLDAIAGLIKTLYEAIWIPNGPAIIESTRCLIDHAINDCVPLDLISGVFDCIKLFPLNPECFGDGGAQLVASMESIMPTEAVQSFCNPESSTTPEVPTSTSTAPTITTTNTGPTVTNPVISTTPPTIPTVTNPTDSTIPTTTTPTVPTGTNPTDTTSNPTLSTGTNPTTVTVPTIPTSTDNGAGLVGPGTGLIVIALFFLITGRTNQ